MSFDLAVWYRSTPMNNKQALGFYVSVCEEEGLSRGKNPSVEGFYQELIAKWPEIDTIAEEKVGDFDYCPWSGALQCTEDAILMNCVWSHAPVVMEIVEQLAQKHDLVLFNPQTSKVILPKTLSPQQSGRLGKIRKLFS